MKSRHTISKPPSIHSDDAERRKCLAPGCGKSFKSTWAGHRICPACSILVSKRNADGLAVQYEGAALC